MRDYTCTGCGTRFSSTSDLPPRLIDVSERQPGIATFMHYGYVVEDYKQDGEVRYVIRCDHPSEALEVVAAVEGKKSKAA